MVALMGKSMSEAFNKDSREVGWVLSMTSRMPAAMKKVCNVLDVLGIKWQHTRRLDHVHILSIKDTNNIPLPTIKRLCEILSRSYLR